MSALVGGDTPQTVMSTPTTVPGTPSRLDPTTDSLAARQRKQFSASGSFTKNYFTGGMSDDVSTVSRVLGGSK